MKLILKQDVDNLGDAGDIVDVADGYGNNYLMPRGLAMPVTKGAVADAEAISRARRTREARSVADAHERRADLERRPVTVQANAGEDGTLYGSIGTTAIAKAVSEQLGLKIDRRKIQLDKPLKELGEHRVGVRVYRDVTADVRVVVAPS
ncbi:MAG: 50S ribosomal protein L9 [Actinobacteria bacterium]|nr:50S ribosomal protein L9 [Actinomycetota bacterium]